MLVHSHFQRSFIDLLVKSAHSEHTTGDLLTFPDPRVTPAEPSELKIKMFYIEIQIDGSTVLDLLDRVVWPVFGGRCVLFLWHPWRPASSLCGLQQEASGGHRGGGSHGRIWVDWKGGNGLVSEAESPAESELQASRHQMTRAWTRSCVASSVRKDQILQMLFAP